MDQDEAYSDKRIGDFMRDKEDAEPGAWRAFYSGDRRFLQSIPDFLTAHTGSDREYYPVTHYRITSICEYGGTIELYGGIPDVRPDSGYPAVTLVRA